MWNIEKPRFFFQRFYHQNPYPIIDNGLPATKKWKNISEQKIKIFFFFKSSQAFNIENGTNPH